MHSGGGAKGREQIVRAMFLSTRGSLGTCAQVKDVVS